MRASTAALGARIYLSIARGTLTRVNDAPKMQTADVRLLHNEMLAGAERFQDYGYTSVPLPGDDTGTAEVIAVFISGNRSHPIIVRIDDRRYRPKNLQPGESAGYDDQGQRVYISRSGIQILGGPSNLPVTVTVGSSTFTVGNGTITATDGAGSTALLDGLGNIKFNAASGAIELTAATIQLIASTILGGNGVLFHKLVTDAFMALYNAHTHAANGDPPSVPMTTAQLTATFTAE